MQEESNTPPRVTFFHETSPASAAAIALSGTYLPGRNVGQPGLTGQPKGEGFGYYMDEPGGPLGRGAVMEFVHEGPHVRVSPTGDYSPAYLPNVLYMEPPSRVILPAGSNETLRLVGVTLKKGASWDNALKVPQFQPFKMNGWLTHKLAESTWRERATRELVNAIGRACAMRVPVAVAVPSWFEQRSKEVISAAVVAARTAARTPRPSPRAALRQESGLANAVTATAKARSR